MASYVLTQLAELQVQTEPVVNFDMDHYRMLHQRLIEHEELLYGTSMQVQVRRLTFSYKSFPYCFYTRGVLRALPYKSINLGFILDFIGSTVLLVLLSSCGFES